MHSLTTSERDVEMRTDHSVRPQTPLLLLLLEAAVEVEVEVEVEESEAGRQRITRPTAVMTVGEAVVGCRAGVSRCLKNLLAVREERRRAEARQTTCRSPQGPSPARHRRRKPSGGGRSRCGCSSGGCGHFLLRLLCGGSEARPQAL